jgi:hypothetical protein
VTDNNLNKKFFTEEDSPVPLIPTDTAWVAMDKKLDEEEKKRRFIIWIPLRIYGLFAVLLTGAAVIIWWGQHITKTLLVKNEDGMVQYPKDSITTSTAVNNNNPTIVNIRDGAGLRADTIKNTHKAKNIQQPFSPEPTLTANDPNGDKTYLKKRPKRKGYHPVESSRPVTSAAAREKEDGTLPFVFTQKIVVTDTISVQTERSLPGVLFQSPAKADSIRKNAFWVEAGVQWNIPVPFDGFRYYMKGADGKNQVYRLVLPGVWLSVNKNRHRIMATVNPFVSTPMPDENFGAGMVPINDSMQFYAHKRMVKMFGYQAGLQYAYRLTGHWWLGSGLDGNWWRKGLVLAKSDDTIAIRNPFFYTINPKTEEKMTSFQMSANLALGYQYKDWEAILQVNTPFGNTIKGISSPIWLRLGVRWRLMNRNVQREK